MLIYLPDAPLRRGGVPDNSYGLKATDSATESYCQDASTRETGRHW